MTNNKRYQGGENLDRDGDFRRYVIVKVKEDNRGIDWDSFLTGFNWAISIAALVVALYRAFG